MKQALHTLVVSGLTQLRDAGQIAQFDPAQIKIELPRDKSHGDFATNVAMMLAKPNGMNPRTLAESLIAHLPAADWLVGAEIAGPGFINFRVKLSAKFDVIKTILQERDKYGRCKVGQGKSVNVEYVSANPTGPLHVGHGRGAAYGSALVSLLRYAGYDVQAEYYVNDAGRQMDILTVSTWLRYLQNRKVKINSFPKAAYQGSYLLSTAKRLSANKSERYRVDGDDKLFSDLPADELTDGAGVIISGDKDVHIDALIVKAKKLLGAERYNEIFDSILNDILSDIKSDLVGESDEELWKKFRSLANVKSSSSCDDSVSVGQKPFGVYFDNFFHEKSLVEDGSIDWVINKLECNGYIYEKDGAKWFKSKEFGDDKDRVVVRENGVKTYFASDIAYHYDKLSRGYDEVINIWGSDHHGYVARVRAAMQALGFDNKKLKILLVQFAVLFQNGQQLSMSTRSGQFVTLRELREDIGNDATRFFYIMRRCDQHMDFDLDLAKSQNNENPLYYIQYAHARCVNIFKQLNLNEKFSWNKFDGLENLDLLDNSSEVELVQKLAQFPEVVASAARDFEPHQVAYYLKDLSALLHNYYYNTRILAENDKESLRNARLTLLAATRTVLANGLTLLGVSAPERM